MRAPSCWAARGTILSRILHGSLAAQAAPLGGFGAFGSLREAPGGFRSLYCEQGDFRPRHDGEAAPPQPQDRQDAAPVEEVDPVEVFRAECFAQGFDEGVRVTQEALGQDRQAHERLAAALEQLSPVDSGTLSAMLSAAVLRLVRQVVGEVAVDPETLRARCAAVAACIEEDDDKAVLRLNPDDLPLMNGAAIGVRLVPDARIGRGSVRLDSADGWVEDGPDVRLARLQALLDDMEGRQ